MLKVDILNSSIDSDNDDDNVMDEVNDDDGGTSSDSLWSPAKQGSCWCPIDRTAWLLLAI